MTINPSQKSNYQLCIPWRDTNSLTIAQPDGTVRYEIYPYVQDNRCMVDIYEVHVNPEITPHTELTNWVTTVALEKLLPHTMAALAEMP